MIKDCPLMKTSKKKDDKKRRAYRAEWDESESESSSDDTSDVEEAANICFIATKSKVSKFVSDFTTRNSTFCDDKSRGHSEEMSTQIYGKNIAKSYPCFVLAKSNKQFENI